MCDADEDFTLDENKKRADLETKPTALGKRKGGFLVADYK